MDQRKPENVMKEQNRDPTRIERPPAPPQADDTVKQAQREKAEVKEVAGRHKNDGQQGHKGRR
jgi:hypothetical protein